MRRIGSAGPWAWIIGAIVAANILLSLAQTLFWFF